MKKINEVIYYSTSQIRDALEAKFEDFLTRCQGVIVERGEFTPEQAAKHILFTRSLYFQCYLNDYTPQEAVTQDFIDDEPIRKTTHS